MTYEKNVLIDLIRKRYKSANKLRLYESYVNRLADRNIPPILSFRHLADILEIPPRTLQAMAFQTELFYKCFNIPKRSGGFRKIVAPHNSLDEIQRWVGQNILKSTFTDFPDFIVGYIPNKSIKNHIYPHLKSSCLIKFDLKEFFPSINSEDVCSIFLELGYTRSVARTLAALMTIKNTLPQGASTSPIISNLYMRDFDKTMSDYCMNNGFTYTRYADDIVVSGQEKLKDHLAELKILFCKHNLNLNHSKTRIYGNPSQVRFITGLILKNEEIRLPKAMRRRIRTQCHLFINELDRIRTNQGSIKNNVIVHSWKNKEFVYDPIFPERIMGKLNYWLHIEPENKYAITMKKRINNMLYSIAEFESN